MTSPSPTPAPTSASIGGITLSVPSGASSGSSSSGDLYGLGAWGSQKVAVGNLPLPAQLIVGTDGTLTGDDLVKGFASADPQSIASIQRALYLGGYYSAKGYQPSYGIIKPEDVAAFGQAVTVAGQSQQPLSDVLLSGAKYGTVAGVAAARSQTTAAKAQVATITLPNQQDLEATAMQAFQQQLGRKPTAAEAAAFASSYRAMSAGMQRANNQAQYDLTTSGGQTAGLTAAEAQADTNHALGVGDTIPGHPVDTSAVDALGPAKVVPDITDPTSPSFSQQLQSLQTVAQEVAQQALPDTTGGGLTQITQESPESPDVAAMNFARNENPNRAAAKDTATAFDSFLNILSSHFGGG